MLPFWTHEPQPWHRNPLKLINGDKMLSETSDIPSNLDNGSLLHRLWMCWGLAAKAGPAVNQKTDEHTRLSGIYHWGPKEKSPLCWHARSSRPRSNTGALLSKMGLRGTLYPNNDLVSGYFPHFRALYMPHRKNPPNSQTLNSKL